MTKLTDEFRRAERWLRIATRLQQDLERLEALADQHKRHCTANTCCLEELDAAL